MKNSQSSVTQSGNRCRKPHGYAEEHKPLVPDESGFATFIAFHNVVSKAENITEKNNPFTSKACERMGSTDL